MNDATPAIPGTDTNPIVIHYNLDILLDNKVQLDLSSHGDLAHCSSDLCISQSCANGENLSVDASTVSSKSSVWSCFNTSFSNRFSELNNVDTLCRLHNKGLTNMPDIGKPLSNVNDDGSMCKWKLIPITFPECVVQEITTAVVKLPSANALCQEITLHVSDDNKNNGIVQNEDIQEGNLKIISSWSIASEVNKDENIQVWKDGSQTENSNLDSINNNLYGDFRTNTIRDPRLAASAGKIQVAKIKPLQAVSEIQHVKIVPTQKSQSPLPTISRTQLPRYEDSATSGGCASEAAVRTGSDSYTEDVQTIVSNVLKARQPMMLLLEEYLVDSVDGTTKQGALQAQLKIEDSNVPVTNREHLPKDSNVPVNNSEHRSVGRECTNIGVNTSLGTETVSHTNSLLIPNEPQNVENPEVASSDTIIVGEVNSSCLQNTHCMDKIVNNVQNASLSGVMQPISLDQVEPGANEGTCSHSTLKNSICHDNAKKYLNKFNEGTEDLFSKKHLSIDKAKMDLNDGRIEKGTNSQKTILASTSDVRPVPRKHWGTVPVLKHLIKHLPFCLHNGKRFVVASDIEEVLFFNHEHLFELNMAQQLNEKGLLFCNVHAQQYFAYQCQLVNNGELLFPVEGLFRGKFLQLVWNTTKYSASQNHKAFPPIGQVSFAKKCLPMVFRNDHLAKSRGDVFVSASDLMSAFPAFSSCLETLALYASRMKTVSMAYSLRFRLATYAEAQALMKHKETHGHLAPKGRHWHYLTSRSILVHWGDFHKTFLKKTVTLQLSVNIEDSILLPKATTTKDYTCPQLITSDSLTYGDTTTLKEGIKQVQVALGKTESVSLHQENSNSDHSQLEKLMFGHILPGFVRKSKIQKTGRSPLNILRGKKRKRSFTKLIKFKKFQSKPVKEKTPPPKMCRATNKLTSTISASNIERSSGEVLKGSPIPFRRETFVSEKMTNGKNRLHSSSLNHAEHPVYKGLWKLQKEIEKVEETKKNRFKRGTVKNKMETQPAILTKASGDGKKPITDIDKWKTHLENPVAYEKKIETIHDEATIKWKEAVNSNPFRQSIKVLKSLITDIIPTKDGSSCIGKDIIQSGKYEPNIECDKVAQDESSLKTSRMGLAERDVESENATVDATKCFLWKPPQVISNPLYVDTSSAISKSGSHTRWRVRLVSLLNGRGSETNKMNDAKDSSKKIHVSPQLKDMKQTKSVMKSKNKQVSISDSKSCERDEPRATGEVMEKNHGRILKVVSKQSTRSIHSEVSHMFDQVSSDNNPVHQQNARSSGGTDESTVAQDFTIKLSPNDVHRTSGLHRSGIVTVHTEIEFYLPYVLNNGFPYIQLVFVRNLFPDCHCSLLKKTMCKSSIMKKNIFMCSFEEAQLLYEEGRQFSVPRVTSGDWIVRIDVLVKHLAALRAEVKDIHVGKEKKKGCYGGARVQQDK